MRDPCLTSWIFSTLHSVCCILGLKNYLLRMTEWTLFSSLFFVIIATEAHILTCLQWFCWSDDLHLSTDIHWVSPWKWFSNFIRCQNHGEGLFKHRLLGPTHRVFDSDDLGGTWEFTFLTSSQVIPIYSKVPRGSILWEPLPKVYAMVLCGRHSLSQLRTQCYQLTLLVERKHHEVKINAQLYKYFLKR